MLFCILCATALGASGCDDAKRSEAHNGSSARPTPATREPDADAVAETLSKLRGSRPNVVLVTICSCRYANLGIAGYKRPTSPFIDRLAADGVLFDQASASSSWTKPTTASILTGLTPNVHGMTDYYEYGDIVRKGFEPKRILADDVVTLAECLKEAGYATFCRNNNIHAGEFFNMVQGFDDSRIVGEAFSTGYMLRDFRNWLKTQDANKPVFFFLLTRDAHIPYVPQYEYYRRFSRSAKLIPEAQLLQRSNELKNKITALVRDNQPIPEDMKQLMVDLYDADLAQLNDMLANIPKVLAEAGRGRNTVIILTADHGERFFDAHGAISHAGGFLEEHIVHVPLIFHGAGMPKGKKISSVVRSIDIYPTITDLAGAEPPDVVQGTSLLPLIAGDDSFPELTAFASYMEEDHMVRRNNYKFHQLRDGTLSLFDVSRDPQELVNLMETEPEIAAEMEKLLDDWLEQERALRQLVARGQTRELSPEVIEELRSLGYVE